VIRFAVDVDNTLIEQRGAEVVLNTKVLALVVALFELDVCELVLWSGGGADYAEHVARKFGVHHLFSKFTGKQRDYADISLDDQPNSLAAISLKLPGDITPTPWMNGMV